MTLARAWYGVTAACAAIGLAIEYQVTISGHPGQLGSRTLVYLSFFTILTNALVLLASIGLARHRGPLHHWARQAGTRTAIAVWITVVAVIFQLLLAGLAHLSSLGWWGNMLVHQLVPALWLGGWLLFRPHGGISATAPLRWLIYPLVYAGWTLAHGHVSGWYPYPFLDIAKRGVERVAITMALMALFFAALGYAYRWLDGRLAQRLAPV
jgi:hypothetical protein